MTVAGSGSSGRPMSRATTIVAHSIPLLTVLAVAARVARLVRLPGMPPFVDDAFMVILLASTFALAYHLRSGALCLRCIRSAPLNPALAIKRNEIFLRLIHLSRREYYIFYCGCVAALIVSTLTTGHFLKTVLLIPIDIWAYSMMWGFWVHHRLRPWCPYCRGWDQGGDEELVPDPDPAETRTA